MKLTSAQFGQNANEDATESSQDIDVQGLPTLLEKLFQMRDTAQDGEPEGISYMSARLLALENETEQLQFINKQLPFLKQANI